MALSYQFIGALISLGLTRSLSDEEFRSYMIDAYAAYSPIYVQSCGAPVWIAVWLSTRLSSPVGDPDDGDGRADHGDEEGRP